MDEGRTGWSKMGAFLKSSRVAWCALGLVVVVAGIICALAWGQAAGYRQELVVLQQELDARVVAASEKITQGLEEKYRADRISYEAMSRRLQLEQQRSQVGGQGYGQSK